jgi:hypothetical protein
MFSFYPSHPRAARYSPYSPPVYSVYPDNDLYSRYHLSSLDSLLPLTNSEVPVRYRRALGEYLVAEEEYSAVLRARKKAKLMSARTEAIRQERARLRVLVAQLARARRDPQARQFKQGLGRALARAAVSGDDDFSLHDVVPVRVTYEDSERPLSDMFIRNCMEGQASCADGASAQKEKVCGLWFESCLRRVLIMAQEQSNAESASEPGECECSVSNLESVLRERLQKIAGDEEVQDLARSILRHLTSATGVSTSAAASSPEVCSLIHNVPGQLLMMFSKVNVNSTQPDEGAHLSRTYALKGATAEAAKASFKAHRAEVAEKTESSPTSPTSTSRTAPSSLAIIEDIRSALTRLSAGFSLPPSLDFSYDEPDGFAYTPTKAPVRVYENALNGLLEQLDAVESDGDEEVRVLRRAAVQEVEKTLEDVEKRVKEARESARQGSSRQSAVSTEADLTEGKNIDGAVDGNCSLDNDKSEVEELSSNSGDRVDSAPLGHDIQPIPNPEVGESNVATRTDAKSVQDDGILEDQPSTADSRSVLLGYFVGSPSGGTRWIEANASTEDLSEWAFKTEVFAEDVDEDEEVTIDQMTSVPSAPEILITPPDSPVEVSLPMRGAIAPSSTPIAPLVPYIIPDELPASFSRDRLPDSVGEDDAKVDNVDDEGEWTEI